MKRLVMIEAGGFAAEVLWVANEMNEWKCIGFADDNIAKQGSTVEGLPIIGTVDQAVEELASEPVWCHCAIGDNARRKAAFEKAVERSNRATLSKRANGMSLVVDDQKLIPPTFLRTKITTEADKVAIKVAIERGEEVPGVRLIQSISLIRK